VGELRDEPSSPAFSARESSRTSDRSGALAHPRGHEASIAARIDRAKGSESEPIDQNARDRGSTSTMATLRTWTAALCACGVVTWSACVSEREPSGDGAGAGGGAPSEVGGEAAGGTGTGSGTGTSGTNGAAGATTGAAGNAGSGAAGSGAGASGAGVGGAGVSGAGSNDASCDSLAASATEVVELTPALFGDGADPVADGQCSDVLNPERGLFTFRDLRSLGDVSDLRADGYTLIYGKVLIDDYRERELDAALLDQLASAFDAVRSAGLKVLPRVYYADDGESPDAPLDRVLSHIEQLTPLLREHADVIAVLHAGFVGAWGEWHASTNGLTEPAARKQIFDALLEALPSDRMTLSRRPSFKEIAYGGPLDESTMFDGSPLARIGHLNDCFLASENDVGTYQEEGEREYAIADSAFVPVGGETCGVNPPRSECDAALAEMELLHWSFLNTSYHGDVIDGFRSGGCFDAIACRLGYRFALLRHASPRVLPASGTLSVALRVVNDGFARMYNPRPVELLLVGEVVRALPVTVDPRAWPPGEPVDLCLAAALPADLPPGSYRLGVRLPDAAESLRDRSDYAVRFANAAGWDAATGTNLLDAHVTIEP
jgi:hypothetical protein